VAEAREGSAGRRGGAALRLFGKAACVDGAGSELTECGT
jgi:hypothetical protein